jgi:phage gp36-like protein
MYCAPSDISGTVSRTKLARILECEDGADIPEEKITPYITAASAKIDAMLGGQYQVPFTDAATLAMMKGLCIPIAKYLIYIGNAEGKIPEEIGRQHDWAMAELKAYAGDPTVNGGKPDRSLKSATSSATLGLSSRNAISFDKVLARTAIGTPFRM